MNSESPCVTCTKKEWNCTCSKYRFWKAEMAGQQFLRDAAESAKAIKEHLIEDD